ncbi:MAG: AMP-binding protein [Pseudomonadota bacterium]
MENLLTAIEQHARQQPSASALVTDQGMLGYAELWRDINQLAEWLTAQHARTVAFQVDNGIEWAVLDLALARAGINSIPVPRFFSDGQRDHVLKDAGVDLFLTDEVTDGLARAVVSSGALVRVPGTNLVAMPLSPVPGGIISGQQGPCKITYTSGSTGAPKGVCLAAGSIDKVTASIVSALAEVPIRNHLCVLPLATLLENIAGLYAPLMRGVTVCVPSLDLVGVGASSLDVEKFSRVIGRFEPDSLILVPQLLTALTTLCQFGMVSAKSFKLIAVGGGRVSQGLLERAMEAGLPVYEGYGLSECGSVVTLNLPGASRSGSVGRALPHARLRVNASGEIEVSGTVMTGYLGQPAQTDAWYATGDLGHIDEDGYVYIDGRRRNVFITAFGRNVNPEWVEASLTQHAAIGQALVVGEARNHNLALLWLRFPQTDAEVASIVATANAELPDYARTHAYIIMNEPLAANFVTDNGRLKREDVTRACEEVIEAHYQQADVAHQETPIETKLQKENTVQFFDRVQKETEEGQQYLLSAPIIHQVFEGNFTLETYVAFLDQAFHHVRHTVPLLMSAGSRLRPHQAWLQKTIHDYIGEEFGHEQWILDDIAACGYDRAAYESGEPPFATEVMVSFLYDYISRINPVGVFGMVLVLEGTSASMAPAVARIVQDKLGLPDSAMTYLTTHGELDQDHIGYFERAMNKITAPEDQAAIIHVANMMYRLYGDVYRAIPACAEAVARRAA